MTLFLLSIEKYKADDNSYNKKMYSKSLTKKGKMNYIKQLIKNVSNQEKNRQKS